MVVVQSPQNGHHEVIILNQSELNILFLIVILWFLALSIFERNRSSGTAEAKFAKDAKNLQYPWAMVYSLESTFGWAS